MTPTGTAHSARRAGTVLLTAAMAFTGMALTAAAGAGTAQRGGAAAGRRHRHGAAVQLRAERPRGQPDDLRHVRRRQRHRLDGQQPGRDRVPGRQLLRHQRPTGPAAAAPRPVTGTTYGYGVYDDSHDHVGERRRLPAGAGDHVPPGRRPRLDHELRRQGDDRRPRLRGDLQPGAGDQPHRRSRSASTRSRRPGLVPLNSAPVAVPAARRPSNHDYAVASDRFGGSYAWPSASALARRGRLRPALRPHARVLEQPAGRDRADHAPARPEPGRRLPDRLHLHPDHPVRRRAEDRRQRLRQGVQPRRHRHPGQPVHPGLHDRRARPAGPGPLRHRHARRSTTTGCGPTRGRGPSTC